MNDETKSDLEINGTPVAKIDAITVEAGIKRAQEIILGFPLIPDLGPIKFDLTFGEPYNSDQPPGIIGKRIRMINGFKVVEGTVIKATPLNDPETGEIGMDFALNEIERSELCHRKCWFDECDYAECPERNGENECNLEKPQPLAASSV